MLMEFLSAAQITFIEGSGITENTVVMIALIGLMLAMHQVLRAPVVSILGGMLIMPMAVFETHVYYFPYLNLLVIVMAMYIIYTGYLDSGTLGR